MGQGTARLRDKDAPGTFILARAHPGGFSWSCQEAVGGCCSLQGCIGTGPSSSSWFRIPQPAPLPARLTSSLLCCQTSLAPCPRVAQAVLVPCPQVPCAPRSLPAPHPAAFPASISGVNGDKTLAPCCCWGRGGGGGSSGGPASAWRGSGDAGDLHCTLPTSRRTPPAGSKPWGGKEGQGGHPAVGCEAAKGRRLQVIPSPGKPAIGRAPRTPNSLPTAGRDATASSAASPSIPGTPWPSLGLEHPSVSFCLRVQLLGQAPLSQGERRGGTVGIFPTPKRGEIKQNEWRRKGRAGEGWRGGAGVSKLPPAICCQLGDSRAPPALCLTGTTRGGTHTHTTQHSRIPHLSAAAPGSFGGGCWPSHHGARGLPGCLRCS